MRLFLSDERGGFAILFAAAFALAAVLGAVAVDSASLYHEKRQVQSAVDMAALAAARDPSRAFVLARGVLVDANVLTHDTPIQATSAADDGTTLVVEPGHYRPDEAVPAAERFVPKRTPFNAVRITYRSPGQLHFARPWAEAPTIGASAIATTDPIVAFSIGSRLARLEGGIANEVLNQLLGQQLSLSLLDYKSLASVEFDAFDFLDALATELGISSSTYEDVLSATASGEQVARAVARLLRGYEGALVNSIREASIGSSTFPVRKLLNITGLGQLKLGDRLPSLEADVAALDVLAASAVLSRDGRVVMGVSANVPGLIGISLQMVVGEPEQHASWFAIGPKGTVVRTSQARLLVTTELRGTPALQDAAVRLPIYLDLAHSEATVASAACPTPSSPKGAASLLVKPGVARLMVGDVGNTAFYTFAAPPPVSPATLINSLLLKVVGSAIVEFAQTTPVSIHFSSADISAGRTKTARTESITTSPVRSLLRELNLTVSPPGLPPGLITAAVHAVLAPVTPTLDKILVQALSALGVSIGEADVRVYSVTCRHPVLVG